MEVYILGHGRLTDDNDKYPKFVQVPPNTKVIFYAAKNSSLGSIKAADILRMNYQNIGLTVEQRLKKYRTSSKASIPKKLDDHIAFEHRTPDSCFIYQTNFCEIAGPGKKIRNQTLSTLGDKLFEQNIYTFGKALFPNQFLKLKETIRNEISPPQKFSRDLNWLLNRYKGKTIHLLSCRSTDNTQVYYTSKNRAMNDLSKKMLILNNNLLPRLHGTRYYKQVQFFSKTLEKLVGLNIECLQLYFQVRFNEISSYSKRFLSILKNNLKLLYTYEKSFHHQNINTEIETTVTLLVQYTQEMIALIKQSSDNLDTKWWSPCNLPSI